MSITKRMFFEQQMEELVQWMKEDANEQEDQKIDQQYDEWIREIKICTAIEKFYNEFKSIYKVDVPMQPDDLHKFMKNHKK